jgi:hypothetical protein
MPRLVRRSFPVVRVGKTLQNPFCARTNSRYFTGESEDVSVGFAERGPPKRVGQRESLNVLSNSTQVAADDGLTNMQ